MSEIGERLAELERLGLGRRLRMVSGPQGPTVLLDGRPVLLLCSNNYLGLADHPRVREAAADAAMRWGVGAGASRLVSGTMTIHRRLEERIADFERCEACVLFGSGYLANLGVIGALAGRGDTVFSDELNHASIVDGCRLSRAEVVVYRHRDVEHLEWNLSRHGRGARLIVTDSVFSMDGDVAPLEDIVALAAAFGARCVVDEAHATGILGPGGRGAVAEAGLEGEVDVVIGTLGKALGSYGAYACASAEMIRYLVNTARSLIFSTAPSPPAIAGALAALELLEERPHRVQRLRSNAAALRRALAAEGFPVADSEMPIVPLIVGEEHSTMRLCREALERGVFAQAIRPPTVPAGSSRLRLAAMALAHALGAGARGERPRRGRPPRGSRAGGDDPGPRGTVPAPEPLEAEASIPGPRAGSAAQYLRDAPFDVERDADLPEVVAATADERWLAATSAAAPADGRRTAAAPAARSEAAADEHEGSARATGEGSAPPDAPFDLERERSGRRPPEPARPRRRARAVRHRDRHRRGQDGAERRAARGDGASRASPCAHTSPSSRDSRTSNAPATPWPADHELLGAAAGMAAEAVAPLRFGPAASPHLAARLAGPISTSRRSSRLHAAAITKRAGTAATATAAATTAAATTTGRS